MPLLPEPVPEGRRIAEAAAERELPLRLLGGVAVALRCPSSQAPPLQRAHDDIDLTTIASARGECMRLLTGLGYREDREFNTLHGHKRLMLWDDQNGRHLDVFVDEAYLCHRIPLRNRLTVDRLTLPLAELTVLKLQVVETNEKDYLDICALFADHDLTEDDSGINAPHIARLAASDWGLWRTLGMVAERSETFARELSGFAAGEMVAGRLRRLREELDTVPKSRGWKLRARVGDRKRWYELPEEVH